MLPSMPKLISSRTRPTLASSHSALLTATKSTRYEAGRYGSNRGEPLSTPSSVHVSPG